MTDGQVAAREPQVRQYLQGQDTALIGLHESLDRLEESLSSVTSSEPPHEGDGKPDEVLVPLASEIRNNVSSIIGATRRVQSIIDRLEL